MGGTTEKKFPKAIWEEAMTLVCPCLRYSKFLKSWIALEEDPCLAKKCGKEHTGCHNYGKKHDNLERLIIFKGVETSELILK